MDLGLIMQVFRDALFTSYKLALPLLLISLVVGLVIAIFQAATQISEQTLTFVPKLIAISLTLLVLGPWMINVMSDFFVRLMDTIAVYI